MPLPSHPTVLSEHYEQTYAHMLGQAALSGRGLERRVPALGHTTIATTADVYGHVTPAMRDRAAERMDGILSDG